MGITYKDSGVDINVGDEVANLAAKVAKRTPHRDYVIQGIGGFAATLQPPKEGRIVVATDGVGTKLLLAKQLNRFDGVGIDLVAMCVNDILCTGARPIGFLDYMAWGRIQIHVAETILESIGRGCEQADAPLVGGETAELPDMYKEDDFDLAGFALGWLPKNRVLTKEAVKKGDLLVAITSTGIHSNGFSLVRRVIKEHKLDLTRVYPGFDRPLGEVLLEPTAIYVKPILQCLDIFGENIHAIAHITGGGIEGNLARVIPEGLMAVVETDRIPEQRLFEFLMGLGVEKQEMFRVFNMGVGMILVVKHQIAEDVVQLLQEELNRYEFLKGLEAFIIGRINEGNVKRVNLV